MTEEAKNARRAYRRKWYAANKDKAKAATERYWERKANRPAAAEQIPGQLSMDPQQ